MERSPCSEKPHTSISAWTKEEDQLLIDYVRLHGEGCWGSLPEAAGLLRSGESCRVRWMYHLNPDIKIGNFTEEEDKRIVMLHGLFGNKWDLIAQRLTGRTELDVKNRWNTHIRPKLISQGIDEPLDTTKVGQKKSGRKRKNKSQVWMEFEVSEKKLRGESTWETSNVLKHFQECFKEDQDDVELNDSTIIAYESQGDVQPNDLTAISYENQGGSQPNDPITIERFSKYLCNISSRFSLTVDLQSYGDKKIMYCCLMLSFIDEEWKLKQKILAFKDLGCTVPTDQTLCEVIEGVISEWNINDDLLLVVDNEGAGANYFLAGELGSLSQSDQCSVLNRNMLYPSSYTRFLNLFTDYAFYEIKGVLHKIRESAEYVNGSPLKKRKFQESINMLNLQDKKMDTEDVPKTWDTTFLMLENALELEKAFSHLEQIDSEFIMNPSAEEWNKARVICQCLKPLHEFISLPSPRLDLFISNVRFIYQKLTRWQDSEFAYVRSMAKKMREKFDECWSEYSFVFEMMAALDPRYKLYLIKFAYQVMFRSHVEAKLSAFRVYLTNLYHKYRNTSSHEALATPTSDDDDIVTFQEWLKQQEDAGVDSLEDELDRYLKLETENLEADVLSWWHVNSSKFPVVGRMARDFLAMDPMPCNRSSAHSSEVIKKNPCFIDFEPDDPIIEALICGQDWLESSEGSNSNI